jgi:hypothetical protein
MPSSPWKADPPPSRGSGALRPLDAPRRVEVWVNPEGSPERVRGRRGWVRILGIRERWEIEDEWWRDPISREYFQVVLETGRPLLLFRDRIEGCWYFQG